MSDDQEEYINPEDIVEVYELNPEDMEGEEWGKWSGVRSKKKDVCICVCVCARENV